MKLATIFASKSKWSKLAAAEMKPSVAYEILKYFRLVNSELELIECQRVLIIHRITNTEDGSDVTIPAGTLEYDKYVKEFSEILGVESSLERIGISMQELLESLANDNMSFTVDDLLVLEPFFSTLAE